MVLLRVCSVVVVRPQHPCFIRQKPPKVALKSLLEWTRFPSSVALFAEGWGGARLPHTQVTEIFLEQASGSTHGLLVRSHCGDFRFFP